MSGNRLQNDPLFQGLARPPMLMGVSYMYFIANAVFNLFGFIWTGNMLVLFIAAPIVHVIGVMICKDEPRAVEMMMMKLSKGLKCKNKFTAHGGANSYDVF